MSSNTRPQKAQLSHLPWRNWLARSTVRFVSWHLSYREVDSSSLSGRAPFLIPLCCSKHCTGMLRILFARSGVRVCKCAGICGLSELLVALDQIMFLLDAWDWQSIECSLVAKMSDVLRSHVYKQLCSNKSPCPESLKFGDSRWKLLCYRRMLWIYAAQPSYHSGQRTEHTKDEKTKRKSNVFSLS